MAGAQSQGFLLFAYDILIDIGLFPFIEGNIQIIGCQIGSCDQQIGC